MISVIIPLYNNASTIERAICSVLNQTYKDFELIIVNDGSTDQSINVVQGFNDNRIRIISQPNAGVSAARNRGIQETKSDLVTFLDADDEWMPSFLETVWKLHQYYPTCAVYATSYIRNDANQKRTSIQLNGIPSDKTFILDNYFEVAAKSDPPICSISVMIRKETLQTVGCFPEDIRQGEDLLTWARLAAKYQIAYCKEPHSIFHTGVTCTLDTPKRIPPADDPVGHELEKLYHQHPETKGLRQYISHWHKMRASMYMRLPHSAQACRNEIRIANQWNKNRKLIIYQLLILIPYQLRIQLLKKL